MAEFEGGKADTRYAAEADMAYLNHFPFFLNSILGSC
jgi:hypothetical protein